MDSALSLVSHILHVKLDFSSVFSVTDSFSVSKSTNM